MTRNGAVRTSAQQITCQPPYSRLRAPPSAYPRAANATAASTSASAASMPLTPWGAAQTRTAASPATAASQNTGGGRSPARTTAIAAVAAGSSPTITLEGAEERGLSPGGVKIGKPTT